MRRSTQNVHGTSIYLYGLHCVDEYVRVLRCIQFKSTYTADSGEAGGPPFPIRKGWLNSITCMWGLVYAVLWYPQGKSFYRYIVFRPPEHTHVASNFAITRIIHITAPCNVAYQSPMPHHDILQVGIIAYKWTYNPRSVHSSCAGSV